MDDLSMNFLKILWQDFKTYNMEDALEDFKRFIKEYKDFVLL
jgi:hypothetical protein